jgi:hypothetical protein
MKPTSGASSTRFEAGRRAENNLDLPLVIRAGPDLAVTTPRRNARCVATVDSGDPEVTRPRRSCARLPLDASWISFPAIGISVRRGLSISGWIGSRAIPGIWLDKNFNNRHALEKARTDFVAIVFSSGATFRTAM